MDRKLKFWCSTCLKTPLLELGEQAGLPPKNFQPSVMHKSNSNFKRQPVPRATVPREFLRKSIALPQAQKASTPGEYFWRSNQHVLLISNWRSCPAFYIVPKKIQCWKVYSNTCSISPTSWAEFWLVDHNDFYATNNTVDSLSHSYLSVS